MYVYVCVCVLACVRGCECVFCCFAISYGIKRGWGGNTREGRSEVCVCVLACMRAWLCLCVFLRSRSPTGSPCEKHHGEEKVCVCFLFFVVSHSPVGLLVCVSFFVFQEEKKILRKIPVGRVCV